MRWRAAAAVGAGFALGCAGAASVSPRPVTAWDSPGFHVIAHRGGAGYAPENTLAALSASAERGFLEVELDVQLSLDEVPVLFHDSTLEEKTGVSGSVAVYTADELREIDIGAWFDRAHPDASVRFGGTGLDALDDVFDAFGARLFYHLEIKGDDPRLPGRLLERVAAAGLDGRVIVTSFSFEQVERVRALDAAVPVCWLLERQRDRSGDALLALQRAQLDRAAQAGVDQVGVPADELGAGAVRAARERGLGIRAWGLEAGGEDAVVASGVDGATTDWPERLFAAAAR